VNVYPLAVVAKSRSGRSAEKTRAYKESKRCCHLGRLRGGRSGLHWLESIDFGRRCSVDAVLGDSGLLLFAFGRHLTRT